MPETAPAYKNFLIAAEVAWNCIAIFVASWNIYETLYALRNKKHEKCDEEDIYCMKY